MAISFRFSSPAELHLKAASLFGTWRSTPVFFRLDRDVSTWPRTEPDNAGTSASWEPKLGGTILLALGRLLGTVVRKQGILGGPPIK